MIQDLLNLTEAKLAYMAGFVDADGSIGIISVAKHKRHVIKLSVSNTNHQAIELFEVAFGGKKRLRTWKGKNKANWKPCYEWCLTADKAARAIRLLCPFLIIKKPQAYVVLRLDRLKKVMSGGRCRWDIDYSEKRQRTYDRLKERCGRLNQRGVFLCDARSYSGAKAHSFS